MSTILTLVVGRLDKDPPWADLQQRVQDIAAGRSLHSCSETTWYGQQHTQSSNFAIVYASLVQEGTGSDLQNVGEPRRVVAVASELLPSLASMTSTRVEFEAATDLQKLLSAPITSFTTFYFEECIPVSWTTELLDLCESSVNVAPGCFGTAIGITEQEIEYSTNRSKAVVLICGWESREHHLAHGKMDSVRIHVNSLMEKACGLDLFHVKLIRAA